VKDLLIGTGGGRIYGFRGTLSNPSRSALPTLPSMEESRIKRRLPKYLWGEHWLERMLYTDKHPIITGVIIDPICESSGYYDEEIMFQRERIRPSYFLGILLSWTASHEENEKNIEKYNSQINQEIEELKKIWMEKPELAVPIATMSGELVWPKKINQLKILAQVGTKDDKVQAQKYLS
jgi:hypothetical protein